MFNLTTKEKLQSAIRRAYRPSSVARERSRTVFLSAVRSTFPSAVIETAGMPKFRYFARGFVTALAVVALVGSVTTYADYADVGTESALYTLKRTSESVRVSLATEEEKPALHLELANRRLKEMKAATEKGRVQELANDFSNEIKQSIVITVSVPAASAPMAVAPAMTPAEPSTVQTFQIEFRTGSLEQGSDKEDDGEGDKDAADTREKEKKDARKEQKERDADSKRARLMAVVDPFCDQLTEMVLDPDPVIRAMTSRDPVLRSLLSERCELDEFEEVFPAGNGIRLATTSIPSLP